MAIMNTNTTAEQLRIEAFLRDLEEKKAAMSKPIIPAASSKKQTVKYDPAPTIDRRKDSDYIDTVNTTERMTLIALAELVAQGKADFLFIECSDMLNLWEKHLELLGQRRGEEKENLRIETIKQSALSKLSDEEKKVLGIK